MSNNNLMTLVLRQVADSNGISAINVMRGINKLGHSYTRQQVSSALQRLRAQGLLSHFGGWALVEGGAA